MDTADGDGSGGSVRLVRGEEVFDEGIFNSVVGVDKADIITSGFLKTEIAGGRLTSVFLMDDFDAFVFLSIVIGDFAGTIGRAIIYQNDFEILVSLTYDRVEAILQIFFGIIDWNYDRNFITHIIIITLMGFTIQAWLWEKQICHKREN